MSLIQSGPSVHLVLTGYIDTTVSVMGVAGLSIGLVVAYLGLRSTSRFAQDDSVSTERWPVLAIALITLLALVSYAASIFLAQLWLICVAFGTYLTMGVWVFFRLLTRSN